MTKTPETLQTIDETPSEGVESPVTASQEGAAVQVPTAEDTPSLDAYRRLYEAQSDTVNELTERVISLQAQIAKLIAGGANVSDGRAEPVPDDAPALPSDYVPLYDLDFSKEIHPKD